MKHTIHADIEILSKNLEKVKPLLEDLENYLAGEDIVFVSSSGYVRENAYRSGGSQGLEIRLPVEVSKSFRFFSRLDRSEVKAKRITKNLLKRFPWLVFRASTFIHPWAFALSQKNSKWVLHFRVNFHNQDVVADRKALNDV
jgi:hypothetical protein